MQLRNIIFLLVFVPLLALTGCKKAVENAKLQLLKKLVTGTTWVVAKYAEGAENKTADYAGYEFQFYENNTVDAIKDGVVETKGSWQASEVTQSVTAVFPSGGSLIKKLGAEWLITNTKSKPWRVFSHRFEGSQEIFLDLQEKQ